MSFNFSDRKFSILANFNKKTLFLISIVILISLNNVKSHDSEEEIVETVNRRFITCGSSLRISNIMTKFK